MIICKLNNLKIELLIQQILQDIFISLKKIYLSINSSK